MMYRITKVELYDEDLNLIKEESIGGYGDECVDSSFYGVLGKASKYCKNRTLKQYLPDLNKMFITDVEDGYVWFEFSSYNIAIKMNIAEFREVEFSDVK